MSRTIGDSLALARRGYGEEEAARLQITTRLVSVKANAATARLAQSLDAALQSLRPPAGASKFLAIGDTLAGIETDLEGADQAPTEAQYLAVAKADAGIRALWRDWRATQDVKLGRINLALRDRRLPAVVVPSADKLVITPPEGGEDLP